MDRLTFQYEAIANDPKSWLPDFFVYVGPGKFLIGMDVIITAQFRRRSSAAAPQTHDLVSFKFSEDGLLRTVKTTITDRDRRALSSNQIRRLVPHKSGESEYSPTSVEAQALFQHVFGQALPSSGRIADPETAFRYLINISNENLPFDPRGLLRQ